MSPGCPDGHHGLSVRGADALGQGAGLPVVQPRHGPPGRAGRPRPGSSGSGGRQVFRYGEHFYNFQGLRRFKEKFDPQWQPKYLSCPGAACSPRPDERRLPHLRRPGGASRNETRIHHRRGSGSAAVLFQGSAVHAEESSFTFGPFGKVMLYREQSQPQPRAVVIFISGDGGWNKGVVEMARTLTRMGAVVAGVNITHFIYAGLKSSKERCVYSAADFEALSKYVQKRLDLPALWASHPRRLFIRRHSGLCRAGPGPAEHLSRRHQHGVLSGLRTPKSPFAEGMGLYRSMHRDEDHGFIAGPGTSHTLDRSAGHDRQGLQRRRCTSVRETRSDTRTSFFCLMWGTDFRRGTTLDAGIQKSIDRMGGEGDNEHRGGPLDDLPLVEVPARGEGSDLFAVIISGDGGWAGLDRDVGESLAERGIPVVGLNALQYFWTRRTPEGASKDLARVLRHYLRAWNKDRFVLIGYSLGAEVLPFMANRLPQDLLKRVRAIVLLGPGRKTEFEFHVTEWLGEGRRGRKAGAARGRKAAKQKCALSVRGRGNGQPLHAAGAGSATVMPMPGGHHFGGEYGHVSDIILKEVKNVQ